MAYYDALIAKWPSVTGATTQAKLDNLNAQVVSVPQPALVAVNDIINAIQSADFLALTQIQLLQLQLLIGGRDYVDASPGKPIRAVFQAVFAGKTTTLAALTALVTPYDSGTTKQVSWPEANGYPRYIGVNDLIAAGGLS
jgi:hypothetical protein